MKKSTMPVILFVVTTPLTANVFLHRHFEELSKHYKIILCVNTNLHDLSSVVMKFVEVIHIDFQRKISLYNDIVSLLKLFLIICRIRPSVVHSVTPKAGLLTMLASYFAGVNFRWHTFTGQIWITRRNLAKFIFKKIDKLIVFFSSQVFTDSESQRNLLVKEEIASVNKISVLGYGSISGVNIERFFPSINIKNEVRKKIAKNQDSCVFLYVGRLARDKGLFDLIEAFRLTFSSLNKIELWIVGPNEEGLQFELEAISQSNNLPISFIGPTDLPEDYMRAADVFVLPSYREGFGTVIIEAGACCVPAIAYRIDGVVDAIEDGFSGILVALKDIESLSKSMLFLAENPNRRIEMGNNARNRVEKFFSSDAITSAWLTQYKTVLH